MNYQKFEIGKLEASTMELTLATNHIERALEHWARATADLCDASLNDLATRFELLRKAQNEINRLGHFTFVDAIGLDKIKSQARLEAKARGQEIFAIGRELNCEPDALAALDGDETPEQFRARMELKHKP